MRALGALGFAVFAVLAAGSTSAAPDDGTRTRRVLASLPAADLGRLAGAPDKPWIAATIYNAWPLGRRDATLFAVPRASRGGLCSVDTLEVAFEYADPKTEPVTDDTLYRVVRPSAGRAYFVADGGDCGAAPIRSDDHARNGADDVFTAPSPRMAARGTAAFAAVLAKVAGKTQLPFTVTCDGPAAFCADPSALLPRFNRHRLDSVGPCKGGRADCIAVSGLDPMLFSWTVEITGAPVAAVHLMVGDDRCSARLPLNSAIPGRT